MELDKEAYFCKKYQLSFLNFPIKDRSVPVDKEAFLAFTKQIDQFLEKASILLSNGIDSQVVFELISKYRGMKVPDTPEQIDWFQKLYKVQ